MGTASAIPSCRSSCCSPSLTTQLASTPTRSARTAWSSSRLPGSTTRRTTYDPVGFAELALEDDFEALRSPHYLIRDLCAGHLIRPHQPHWSGGLAQEPVRRHAVNRSLNDGGRERERDNPLRIHSADM